MVEFEKEIRPGMRMAQLCNSERLLKIIFRLHP